MIINLNDVSCVKIGSILISVNDIEDIHISEGYINVKIHSDTTTGRLETKVSKAEIVVLEETGND